MKMSIGMNFIVRKKEVADKWDGHTDKDVLYRLYYANKKIGN